MSVHPTHTPTTIVCVHGTDTTACSAVNQRIATKFVTMLGFQVAAAWNGKEALDYIRDSQEGKNPKPNVILMDCQMPVVDGYECTHA